MKASQAIEPQCPLLAMAKAARLTFWKWIFSFCLFCHHSESSYLGEPQSKKGQLYSARAANVPLHSDC